MMKKLVASTDKIEYMNPLEKVFFLKNMCHTGTSNGGKKWRMVLFQVDSYIESP